MTGNKGLTSSQEAWEEAGQESRQCPLWISGSRRVDLSLPFSPLADSTSPAQGLPLSSPQLLSFQSMAGQEKLP